MRFLQSLVVFFAVGPMRPVFRAIYALGLKAVVWAVSRHQPVHSIYGCGSFFEKRLLAGHSDIDLIIIMAPSCKRTEGYHTKIAKSYNRVRRLFPFLGRWDEKAENLIFLEEIESGFPVPASFRLRMKQDRLKLLHGDPYPDDFTKDPVSVYEVLSEGDTLLKSALVTEAPLAKTCIFWKRQFSKLLTLARALKFDDFRIQIQSDGRLSFLGERDRRLFFKKADPEGLFTVLCGHYRRLLRDICKQNRTVKIVPGVWPPGKECAHEQTPAPVQARRLVFASGASFRKIRTLPSSPIGLAPRLFYFPTDTPVALVELEGVAYAGIRLLRRAMIHH